MNLTEVITRYYGYFEKLIIFVLLVLLAIMVVWGTWAMGAEILSTAAARLTGGAPVQQAALDDFIHRLSLLREVFAGFMLVLIGVELMKTIVTYLDHRVLHEEVVFTVAIIAVARHAISVDLETASPMSLLGVSAMVLALSFGYYAFRKAAARD